MRKINGQIFRQELVDMTQAKIGLTAAGTQKVFQEARVKDFYLKQKPKKNQVCFLRDKACYYSKFFNIPIMDMR